MHKNGKLQTKVFFRTVLTGVILSLSIFYVAGCGTLETLLKRDAPATTLGQWVGGKTEAPASGTEGKTVSLYFADASGKYLIKEERTLPKTVSIARETINQWLKGPAAKDGGSQPAVTPGTALLDIAIKDNIATVDLSKEFLQQYTKVVPEVTLYGLANTLTQFPTVKEVRVRVEGKALTNYAGIDISHLGSKASLVKGNVAATNDSTEYVQPKNGSALPESPSSINLFAYPPTST